MYSASYTTVNMVITHSYSEKKCFVSFGREKMEKFWTIKNLEYSLKGELQGMTFESRDALFSAICEICDNIG